MITYVMACKCGAETDCESDDQKFGRVWQCPACDRVTACVLSKSGRKLWITVDPKEVEFYHLLRVDTDDDV